jgi:hypothetical protein
MQKVIARFRLTPSSRRRVLALIGRYALVLIVLEFLGGLLLGAGRSVVSSNLDASVLALIKVSASVAITFGVYVHLAKRHSEFFVEVGTGVAIVVSLVNLLFAQIKPHTGPFRPLYVLVIALAANALLLYLAARFCGMLSNNRWRGP